MSEYKVARISRIGALGLCRKLACSNIVHGARRLAQTVQQTRVASQANAQQWHSVASYQERAVEARLLLFVRQRLYTPITVQQAASAKKYPDVAMGTPDANALHA